MKFARDLITKIINALFMLCAILFGLATILAFVNAFCRKFLGIGITWAEELTTYSIVIAFFLSIPYMELHNGSLCIDLLSNVVKNKAVMKVLYILRGIVVMFLCYIVARYGFVAISSALNTNLTTFTLRWPKSIFYSIAVAGFILTVVSWLTILLFNKGDEIK